MKRYLFIYFTVETHISALAGRIFAFLRHSIGFRCDFCFPFRHLTDLPPKFHKVLKPQNVEPFSPPKPDCTAPSGVKFAVSGG